MSKPETYYICKNANGNYDMSSIRRYKKTCISNFISGTNMTWEECKDYGWQCLKVNINIIELTTKTTNDGE